MTIENVHRQFRLGKKKRGSQGHMEKKEILGVLGEEIETKKGEEFGVRIELNPPLMELINIHPREMVNLVNSVPETTHFR